MKRMKRMAGPIAAVLAAGTLGFACAVAVAAGSAGKKPATAARLIKVSAHRYEFVPKDLTLKKGEPVDIELSTADVLMGFNAPDFAKRQNIMPGQVTHVTFTPMKTGTFTFLCDVFCGSGHEDMNGTITVVE